MSSKTTLASSHSLSSPAKDDAIPKDGVAAEALGSTGDHDRDSTVGISENDTDQSGDESESDCESWESISDSNLESTTGDCLTCSDTEEAAVRSACQKFCKKVQASCRLVRQSLWKVSQMALIGKVIRLCRGMTSALSKKSRTLLSRNTLAPLRWTRWKFRLTNCSKSRRQQTQKIFILGSMMPMCMGRRKTLVQSLKQFHTYFYQLYKKVMTHAMVSLQYGAEVFLPLVF